MGMSIVYGVNTWADVLGGNLCRKGMCACSAENVLCQKYRHQKYRQCAMLCVCVHMQQHQKNFHKKSNDMTRCDNVLKQLGTYADRLVSAFAFSAGDEVSTDDSDDEADSRSAAASSVPLITMPVVATPLCDLASRLPACAEEDRRFRAEAYTIQRAILHVSQGLAPRNMVHVMKKWEYFVQDAQSLCSHKFWKFFCHCIRWLE